MECSRRLKTIIIHVSMIFLSVKNFQLENNIHIYILTIIILNNFKLNGWAVWSGGDHILTRWPSSASGICPGGSSKGIHCGKSLKSGINHYLIGGTGNGTQRKVGLRTNNAIVLGVEKRSVGELQEERMVRKICMLDDHVALTFSGLTADARILVSRAQMESQSHRLNFEKPVTVEYITRWGKRVFKGFWLGKNIEQYEFEKKTT